MAESSNPPQSDVHREELLDRMLTRLALADDPQLEPLLAKIVPYSIASLASTSPSIRKLVMEILGHVNKRVKHQMQIRLPLLELWNMYREDSAVSMVRNFCIVYIEMAFQRLTMEEKATMAPELLVGLSNLPAQHQDIILRTVCKVIGECHSKKLEEDIRDKYKVMGSTRDRELFVEFCLYTVLYHPPSSSASCPSGLSVSQSDRVTGKLPLYGDMLLKRKMGILNVIDAMDSTPELVYPLYLAACSDSQDLVAKKGEELLKKKSSGVNLESPDLIRRLFLLFNGTVDVSTAESKVAPGSLALKSRLMSVFCRSITAANSFPSTLQCIFGCIFGSGTTTRLKQLGMEFTVWVFKHAAQDQLKLMGPVILSGILKSLDSKENNESDIVSRDVKNFMYQATGLIAVRLPQLFRDKIDMAVRLFNALKVEDQALRLTIQEATTSLAMAYKGAPAAVLKELEVLLLENFRAEQSEVRFCAVRWACSLYDFQNCTSRFICMVGAADSRLDIREMALEGLSLSENNSQSTDLDKDQKFPKLEDMLDYIVEQQPKLMDSIDVGHGQLLFPSKMFCVMVNFLMKCFDISFGRFDCCVTPDAHPSMVKLCLLLEHALAFEGSIELHATASKALVTIGSRVPKMVAPRYAGRISWLRQLLGHVDADTRESISRVLGIACAALSAGALTDLISELVSSCRSTRALRFENHHGMLCAIGYIVAECVKENTISEVLLQSTVSFLVNVVESESSTLASVAMEALGHIGLRCTLPTLPRDSTSGTVLSVLEEKLAKILAGTDIKAIQKIIISFGHLSVKETSFAHVEIALELIFSLCRSKVEDVLFACGEALSFIWGEVPVTVDDVLKTNFNSLSQTSNFLSTEVSSLTRVGSLADNDNEECRVMSREAIVRKIFDTLLYSSRKEERCAGTVWLVSLLMYCGRHPKIQQLLPDIQEAFSHLLGEKNELTQELASQGMSIVYELGDSSMKEGLVNSLVGTLTGSGKMKRVVKLMGDTEIFQEGTIGENPGGGKLSSYKELCNLANEMGQPDLIYKFMDLANYQASLNSKRGAAFGFSKIAKHAGDALQPHLGSLIPRLLRYQYDPDKNVQDAMGHIWKSIVTDSKKTIDDHFDSILDDLLTQSGSRLWRSREASCRALADLIQGRKFFQVSKHLKRIWIAAFRAMDDIKETVRSSGDSLYRSLSSLTIRLCDVSLTPVSDASETMSIVLPMLLTEGIVSKVESIQKASVTMVMKLSKGAGVALRPHLSDLVCCMLESLSSLEDQRLNYVEMHAGSVGIHTDKLDSLRISVAKDSPMWETLDVCLKVVDKQALDALVPRLAQLVRAGVGLNTRVGVANFITLLVQKVNDDIKPFTSTLLKLLFRATLDEKSIVGKKAYAAACAIALKYATPALTQQLVEDTAALHLGDRNSQMSCAILLKNYSRLVGEIISGYHATIFPVTFISRFEDDKDISSLFEELWEDAAGSERISLQLYLSEIVSLLLNCFASSSWASKKKSALAIKKLTEVLGESLSPVHHDLLDCLLKELTGRLWEGKEAILYAVAALCSSCHKAISSKDAALPDVIVKAISSACTKKQKLYCEAAYSCLQQVIKAFGKPEFFCSVFPLLSETCMKTSGMKLVMISPTDTEGTGSDDSDPAAPIEKVLDCVTSCIHVALVQNILEQREVIMHIFVHVLSPGFSWTVKASAFASIKEVCSKLHQISHDMTLSEDGILFLHELYQSMVPAVLHSISTVKISQVHIAASECLLDIIKLYKEVPLAERKDAVFKNDIIELCESEKNEQAKSLLKQCSSLIESLKKE